MGWQPRGAAVVRGMSRHSGSAGDPRLRLRHHGGRTIQAQHGCLRPPLRQGGREIARAAAKINHTCRGRSPNAGGQIEERPVAEIAELTVLSWFPQKWLICHGVILPQLLFPCREFCAHPMEAAGIAHPGLMHMGTHELAGQVSIAGIYGGHDGPVLSPGVFAA